MQTQDKVAIVTGASSGIGLATAKLLTEKGAKVALVSRTFGNLEDLSRTLVNSFPFAADMSNKEQIKNMIEQVHKHYGKIDILVNSAGKGYAAPVEKTIPETFQKIFDLDVIGPLVAMQQVIPHMRQQGGGTIINVSSGTALLPLLNNGAYSATKRAVAQMSLTARDELKKDRITVSVFYPYITDTDFEKNTLKDSMEDHIENVPPFPIDPAEFAAVKILEAIDSEKAEIFAHDWMQS